MAEKMITNILEVSALDPIARIDAHERLDNLRENCPVFRDEANKSWFLSRFEDVRKLAIDPNVPRSPELAEEGAMLRVIAGIDSDEGEVPRDMSILFLDNPDHARIRRPLATAFYARINKMKSVIEGIVDELIDAAPKEGSFDFMAEIAVPIPILIIARIIGVDEHRVTEFRQWSEGSFLSFNPIRTPEENALMQQCQDKLSDYFEHLIKERRISPQNDLVSDLITLQNEGMPVTDAEIKTNLTGLLLGGNMTTTDLMGNGVWLLLTHSDELEKLRSDPGLAAAAVEETLRYEAPVAVTARVLAEDTEIAGCPMEKSQVAMLSLQAANRDPAVFENPENFNITRPRQSHIAFGGGAHICIGAPLARMEATRAFVRIFQRYPNMKLAETVQNWRALPFFRGLETLNVNVD